MRLARPVTVPAATWPGPTNTGHLNHPSWPGSFTGGVDTTGTGHSVTGDTVNFKDFQSGWSAGTVSVAANNVTFNGCRFQYSANVNNVTGDNTSFHCLLFGSNITFNYCTFQPSAANYPSELTGEELTGSRSTYVEYGKSYQFALVGDGAYSTSVGKLTVTRCDFWGFGNCFQLSGSTVANPHVVQDSWFHHGGDPWVENTVNTIHNDVWLCNSGNYYGAQFLRNRAEIWGNTNVVAWQGAGAYDDGRIVGNLIGGDQETMSLSSSGTSARLTVTDNYFSTRVGRSVGTGRPLRGWFVSDSGTGSLWRRNRWLIGTSEATANYPSANWGNPAKNDQFWWPGDDDTTYGHASDYTG